MHIIQEVPFLWISFSPTPYHPRDLQTTAQDASTVAVVESTFTPVEKADVTFLRVSISHLNNSRYLKRG